MAAASGRIPEEALHNVKEIVHMIVEEFVEEGRPLPEGPADSVEVVDLPGRIPYRRHRLRQRARTSVTGIRTAGV